MPEYKELLGALAVIIGLFGSIHYFRDLFNGKTKPHVFSWLMWGVLTGIGFFASFIKGGGAGVWVGAVSTLICFFIAIYAMFKGEKNITRIDWLCLIGAGLALAFWAITREPLTAIVLIIIVDALAYAPTFRKSYSKPFEETLSTYFLSGIKYIPALFAIASYNPTTVLYPAYLLAANLAFTAMLVVRRRALGKKAI